jgi:hypothetical protein
MLRFRAISQSEATIDIDAEVADRALDLRMAGLIPEPCRKFLGSGARR